MSEEMHKKIPNSELEIIEVKAGNIFYQDVEYNRKAQAKTISHFRQDFELLSTSTVQ